MVAGKAALSVSVQAVRDDDGELQRGDRAKEEVPLEAVRECLFVRDLALSHSECVAPHARLTVHSTLPTM